jgi:hypothetical protein
MQFQDDVVGGVTLIRPAIQSPDYVTGTSGWSINVDGTAEFSDLTIRSSDGSGNTVEIANGVITIYNSLGDVVSTISETGYKVWESTGTDVLAEVTLAGGTLTTPGFIARYESYPHIYSFMGNGGIQWVNEQTSMFIEPEISMTALAVEDDEINMIIIPGAYTASANVPRLVIGTSALGNSEFRIDSRDGGDPDIKLNGQVTIQGGKELGRGQKTYAAIQANTATVTTTETAAITTGNVTFKNGRAYRVIAHGLLQSSVAGDVARMRVRRTSTAGTILIDSMHAHYIPVASTNVLYDHQQPVINTSGSDITDVLVSTFVRTSGTGNIRVAADATNPAWIEVRDIGLATDYPSARTL